MSSSTWHRCARGLACVVMGVAFVAPARAENWKRLNRSANSEISINLDTLRWSGRTVTYTSRLWLFNDAKRQGGYSTSVMDCERRMRKLVHVARFKENAWRESNPAEPWRPAEWGASRYVSSYLCDGNAPAPATANSN